MLVSYHLPITDLRPFLGFPAWKIGIKNWSPIDNPAFIKGFGPVRNRILGGDSYHGGGEKVCDASKGIRFETTDPQISLPDGSFLKVDCAFRRVFSLGGLSAKVEIGFTEKYGRPLAEGLCVQSILEGFNNLPVVIKFPHTPLKNPTPNRINVRSKPRYSETRKLGLSGKFIAE